MCLAPLLEPAQRPRPTSDHTEGAGGRRLVPTMLPQEGGVAIILKETGIATRGQEMHLDAALRDNGYSPFFASRLAKKGSTSTSREGGLLTAVTSRYVAEHEVLRFTEFVPGEAAALEIGTEKGGLTLFSLHGPQAGCSPWVGRAAFWADIQMYATTRSFVERHPVVIAGDTNMYMDAATKLATEHLHSGLEACGFRRATAGWDGRHDPHTPDVPTQGGHLPCQRAAPAMVPAGERLGLRHGTSPGGRSDHLPVRPALPGLLDTGERRCPPLQPYRGPPSSVSRQSCARPALPVSVGHRRTRRALPGALAGPCLAAHLQGPCLQRTWTRCSNTSTQRMTPSRAWWGANSCP